MPTRYFTASIPYVNADPHVGYALELVETDALVRYYRAAGDEVRGQFGSDDNSLKVVRAAKAAGEEVETYAARHAKHFEELRQSLNIVFGEGEEFMRTRAEHHMRGAQKLWSAFKKEDLYQKSYEGFYCVGCEAFYDATDLLENNVCPTHQKPCELIKETNWFFKLSNYQKAIEDLIESDALKVWPSIRKNEILAFVKRGLEDFSISRSVERAENWGVPVPGDESQVMYVWVDALSNYITSLGYADDGEAFKKFWTYAQTRTHVIGKDIIRFHTVYWPAFLLSAGLPLPSEVFVHGFLTLNGQKISKSIGNVIAPSDLIEKYGTDATRLILLSALPLEGDGDLSGAFFDATYTRLANGLGNLVGRVAAMANKYFDGLLDAVEYPAASTLKAELSSLIEARDFKTYLEKIWEQVDVANHQIDVEAPFKSVKTDPAAAKKTLSEVAAIIRVVAEALLPIMPTVAGEILHRYSGPALLHGDPLFPKEEAPL